MNIFGRIEITMTPRPSCKGFKVYTTPWRTVGCVNEFPMNEPQVVNLDEQAAKKGRPRTIYVLRLTKGFKVFDLQRGGQYEWKVWRGQLLIRRRRPETEEKKTVPNSK